MKKFFAAGIGNTIMGVVFTVLIIALLRVLFDGPIFGLDGVVGAAVRGGIAGAVGFGVAGFIGVLLKPKDEECEEEGEEK